MYAGNVPSVSVLIGSAKRLLGNSHFGFFRQAKKVLRHAEYLFMIEGERHVNQVREADRGKNIVELRRELAELFFAGALRRERREVDNWERRKRGSHGE